MALSLGRVAGEKIYVGTDVVITVVRISGATVKVSIQAPRSVSSSAANCCRLKSAR